MSLTQVLNFVNTSIPEEQTKNEDRKAAEKASRKAAILERYRVLKETFASDATKPQTGPPLVSILYTPASILKPRPSTPVTDLDKANALEASAHGTSAHGASAPEENAHEASAHGASAHEENAHEASAHEASAHEENATEVDEGEVFFDAMSSINDLFNVVSPQEGAPTTTISVTNLFDEHLGADSRSVTFSDRDIIVPFDTEQPPMEHHHLVSAERLRRIDTFYRELTQNPESSAPHPDLRNPKVKFATFPKIVKFKKTSKLVTLEDASLIRARKIIKSAHSVMFEEIKERMIRMSDYIEAYRSSVEESKPNNFRDYLRSCNTLCEVMGNMMVLTRDSLKLLLSVKLYKLSLKDENMIAQRINELDMLIKVEKANMEDGIFSSALSYFITTGNKLTDINNGCISIFDDILTIYGPKLSAGVGRDKREYEISDLVFELLELNLGLYNLHVSIYYEHLERVLSLHSLFNKYISNLTSESSKNTTVTEKAQFNFDFQDGLKLSQMGGLNALLLEIVTQQNEKGGSLINLTDEQIDLLKTVEERRAALAASAKTANATPSFKEIDGLLGLFLFMLKITLVFVVIIFNYIEIIWKVPFDFETRQFQIIENNDEFFKLRKIKLNMDTLVSKIEDTKNLTDVSVAEIPKLVQSEQYFKLNALEYARDAAKKPFWPNPTDASGGPADASGGTAEASGGPAKASGPAEASGGARKLTKKRRKKSAKTKTRRKRNQTLRRKKPKSKSKHSRRKRKQLRK